MKISKEQIDNVLEFLRDGDGEDVGVNIGNIASTLTDIAIALNKLSDVTDVLKEAMRWYCIQVQSQVMRDGVQYNCVNQTDAAISTRILLDKWARDRESK